MILAADRDGLCRPSGGLGTGLTRQLAQRDGLFLPLLVLLVLLLAVLAGIVLVVLGLAVLVVGSGLCGRLLVLLALCLGSLVLGLLVCLLLRLLVLGLRLFLGLLCAVQESSQILLAVVLAEFLQQVVQLVLLEIGAVLLPGAAHGSQLIQNLLGREVQVFCKIAHFIFYDHSLISSSFLIAPQSLRRSKQSFARLRSVTAYTATGLRLTSASRSCVRGIRITSTRSPME